MVGGRSVELGSSGSQESRTTSYKSKSLLEGLANLEFRRKAAPPIPERSGHSVAAKVEGSDCDFSPSTPLHEEAEKIGRSTGDDSFLESLTFSKAVAPPPWSRYDPGDRRPH